MSPNTPPSATDKQATATWRWGKSVTAAAWPLLCALGFAAYAFFPERFPEKTGITLLLLAAAEVPSLLLGMVHATALAETTVKGRLLTFVIGLVVLMVLAVLHVGFDFELSVVAPILLWVVVPHVIDLCSHQGDPVLASRQAEAVIEDKTHLISLIPTVVIGGVLLAILANALLAVLSVAMDADLSGDFTEALGNASPSLFALFGSAYLLIGAASAAHVHRPVFLRERKRLLDQPWINRLVLQSRTSESE